MKLEKVWTLCYSATGNTERTVDTIGGELAASLKEKGITFTYDDALVDWLTRKSYSLTYGARNLRRTIQKEVEDPMATKIIDSYEHPITQVKATVEDEKVRLYTL